MFVFIRASVYVVHLCVGVCVCVYAHVHVYIIGCSTEKPELRNGEVRAEKLNEKIPKAGPGLLSPRKQTRILAVSFQ